MNRPLQFLLFILLAAIFCGDAHAQLYVVYSNAGLVSEYDADTGKLINETLIMGLSTPRGICLDEEGTLYIVQAGNGTIGKFDARTGRVINMTLVSNLNMPQAIAVADGVLYVSDFDASGIPRVGKYHADNGATMSPSFLAHVQAPSGLAVIGGSLFVAGDGYGGIGKYDATTGKVIRGQLGQLGNACGIAAAGNWLYVTAGANAPSGCVLKLDRETGVPAVNVGFFRPLLSGLDYPSSLTISDDDLYVSSGHDSSIGKYNATTGAAINPALVPALGDRVGGIVVVPTAASGKHAYEDARFVAKTYWSNFALVMLSNGNYVFLGIGALVALVVVGLALILMRRGALLPVPVARERVVPPAFVAKSIEGESARAPGKRAVPPPYIPRQTAPVRVVPQAGASRPYSIFSLLMIATGVIVVTTVAASIVGFLTYQWAISTRLVQMESRDNGVPDDLVGVWLNDNSESRKPDEVNFYHQLVVYTSRLDYSTGRGLVTLRGEWRGNSFWSTNNDGDEIEEARIVAPDQIKLRLAAFDPASTEKEILYKERGSEAERRALAAKYPEPIVYPPPAGVIKVGMSLYDLKSLPWQPEKVTVGGYERYDFYNVYTYRSDSELDPLQVTVKNRRVTLVRGGNS